MLFTPRQHAACATRPPKCVVHPVNNFILCCPFFLGHRSKRGQWRYHGYLDQILTLSMYCYIQQCSRYRHISLDQSRNKDLHTHYDRIPQLLMNGQLICSGQLGGQMYPLLFTYTHSRGADHLKVFRIGGANGQIIKRSIHFAPIHIPGQSIQGHC